MDRLDGVARTSVSGPSLDLVLSEDSSVGLGLEAPGRQRLQ